MNHRRSLIDKQSSLAEQVSILEKISGHSETKHVDSDVVDKQNDKSNNPKPRPVAFVPPRMLSQDKMNTLSPIMSEPAATTMTTSTSNTNFQTPMSESPRRPRGRPRKRPKLENSERSSSTQSNSSLESKADLDERPALFREEWDTVLNGSAINTYQGVNDGAAHTDQGVNGGSAYSNQGVQQFISYQAHEERAPIHFPTNCTSLVSDDNSKEFVKMSSKLLSTAAGKWQPLSKVDKWQPLSKVDSLSNVPDVQSVGESLENVVEKIKPIVHLDKPISIPVNETVLPDQLHTEGNNCHNHTSIQQSSKNNIYDNLQFCQRRISHGEIDDVNQNVILPVPNSHKTLNCTDKKDHGGIDHGGIDYEQFMHQQHLYAQQHQIQLLQRIAQQHARNSESVAPSVCRADILKVISSAPITSHNSDIIEKKYHLQDSPKSNVVAGNIEPYLSSAVMLKQSNMGQNKPKKPRKRKNPKTCDLQNVGPSIQPHPYQPIVKTCDLQNVCPSSQAHPYKEILKAGDLQNICPSSQSYSSYQPTSKALELQNICPSSQSHLYQQHHLYQTRPETNQTRPETNQTRLPDKRVKVDQNKTDVFTAHAHNNQQYIHPDVDAHFKSSFDLFRQGEQRNLVPKSFPQQAHDSFTRSVCVLPATTRVSSVLNPACNAQSSATSFDSSLINQTRRLEPNPSDSFKISQNVARRLESVSSDIYKVSPSYSKSDIKPSCSNNSDKTLNYFQHVFQHGFHDGHNKPLESPSNLQHSNTSPPKQQHLSISPSRIQHSNVSPARKQHSIISTSNIHHSNADVMSTVTPLYCPSTIKMLKTNMGKSNTSLVQTALSKLASAEKGVLQKADALPTFPPTASILHHPLISKPAKDMRREEDSAHFLSDNRSIVDSTASNFFLGHLGGVKHIPSSIPGGHVAYIPASQLETHSVTIPPSSAKIDESMKINNVTIMNHQIHQISHPHIYVTVPSQPAGVIASTIYRSAGVSTPKPILPHPVSRETKSAFRPQRLVNIKPSPGNVIIPKAAPPREASQAQVFQLAHSQLSNYASHPRLVLLPLMSNDKTGENASNNSSHGLERRASVASPTFPPSNS